MLNLAELLTALTSLASVPSIHFLKQKHDHIVPSYKKTFITGPSSLYEYTKEDIIMYYNDNGPYVDFENFRDDSYLAARLYVPLRCERTEYHLSNSIPIVIGAHGLGNSNVEWEKWMLNFVYNGYAVVTFDYRNWGDSSSSPDLHTLVDDQIQDLMNIILMTRNCIKTRELDLSRIYLLGYSLSGGHVLTVAERLSKINAPYIAGVISVAPYIGLNGLADIRAKAIWFFEENFGEFHKFLRNALSQNTNTVMQLPSLLDPTYFITALQLGAYKPSEIVTGIKYPTLFLTSYSDQVSNSYHVHDLYLKMLPNPVQHYSIPQGTHSDLYKKYGDELFAYVCQFLNTQ